MGGEKFLEPDAVPQVGELKGDFKVAGDFLEDFQLLQLRLAHLSFDVEQQLAQPGQIIFPLLIFPALVIQKIENVLPSQIFKRDDFRHGFAFGLY
jgi:hypothetical protein